jgi:hypothetical protein
MEPLIFDAKGIPRSRAERVAQPPAIPLTHESATPEDIVYSALHSVTALKASWDLCRMLCVPQFLMRWANALVHTRPEGALGNDGVHTVTTYLTRMFEVFVGEELNFEVECTVGCARTWLVYPFGFAYRYIVIPVELFSDTPGFLAALQRMVLVEHGNLVSPVHSAQGGAFARTTAITQKNRVTFSGFAYNRLMDLYFPRFQFVACFSALLSAHTRNVDRRRGIDVDRVLAIGDPLNDIDTACALKFKDSESASARFLIRCALDKILADFTFRMHQVKLHKENVAKNGKPIESTSTVGYRSTTGDLSDAQSSALRRVEFYASYLNGLRAMMHENDGTAPDNVQFTPKALLACWTSAQADIARRASLLYPINTV